MSDMYMTGNPVPSSDAKDRYDNSIVLDRLINGDEAAYLNRIGKYVMSLNGMRKEVSEFLLKSGYEHIGDYADGPLLIERPNQIFSMDGEFWRPSASLVLPYTTTGFWSSDKWNFVSVGDASLRQELASDTGASRVGIGGGVVSDYIGDRVHVRKFGVKPGLAYDNSTAVKNAIIAGVPLNWGKKGDIIRVTERINVTALGAVDWYSSGAKILFDPPAVTVAHALDIDILGGVRHSIKGELYIDGQDKASVGLRLFNRAEGFPAAYGYASLRGVHVSNIFRANNTADGGDGIILRGAFRQIDIDQCTVDNVHMAAGAGIVGSAGVTGITVSPQAAGYPVMVNCSRLDIRNIKSDDPSVQDDQDGLRVFSGWGTRSGNSENILNVSDSQFTDCYGRSIKAQTEVSFIRGCKFAAYGGPTLGRNQDIDLQVGGGVVRDCTFYYANQRSCPATSVSFQPAPGWEAFSGVASDLKIFIASGTLQSTVATYPRARTQHRTVVRGVDCIGAVSRLLDAVVWSGKSDFSVSDCTVNNLDLALVRVTANGAGGSPYSTNVSIKGCTNLGAEKPLVIDSIAGVAAKATVSDMDCIGFARSPVNDSGQKGGLTRIPYRAGTSNISGTDYIEGRLLAAGEVWDLGVPGYSGRGLMRVASTLSIAAQGEIAFSSSGATRTAERSVGATGLVVGNTAQPSTGELQVWFDTSLKIRNNSGASAVVTVNILG